MDTISNLPSRLDEDPPIPSSDNPVEIHSRPKLSWSKIAIFIFLTLTVLLTGLLISRPLNFWPSADEANPELILTPNTISLPPEIGVKVLLNPNQQQLGFIRINLKFNQNQIKLTNITQPTSPLWTLIETTDVETANTTGSFVLTIGLAPGNSPPNGTFELTTLSFDTNTIEANQTSILEFNPDNSQLVNLQYNTFIPTVNQVQILVNQILPTTAPTTEPTAEPTTEPTTKPTTKPTTTPTSTSTPTPEKSTDNDNHDKPSSDQGCHQVAPGPTNLFQINTHKNQAILYFSPASSATRYLVEYGPNKTYLYSVFFSGDPSGVNSVTISVLKSNTVYSFRIQSFNDCQSGDWSNAMSVGVTNSSKPKIYYKNIQTNIQAKISKSVNTISKPFIKLIPVTQPKFTIDNEPQPEPINTLDQKEVKRTNLSTLEVIPQQKVTKVSIWQQIKQFLEFKFK